MKNLPAIVLILALTGSLRADAQPITTLDLAEEPASSSAVRRILGADGQGVYGVPLAGGFDVDGDGSRDYAVAFLTASPLGRTRAGEIDLVFGNGTFTGTIDTAVHQARVLRILGAQTLETAGSEVWMDDVTGDGLGDLLICRQNYSPSLPLAGAGALTIVVGGAALRTYAAGLAPLDLAAPPVGLTLTTLTGKAYGDRLGIWVRTGDVTGDGVADIVIGADQENGPSQTHRGGVYVIQGGPHLAAGGTYSLLAPGALFDGRIAHITPPAGSDEFHLGATCLIADLDGNGVGEVLAAAALNRAGASISSLYGPTAHASAGAPRGRLYIVWDDHFAPPWPTPYELSLGGLGGLTMITGGIVNIDFGEELLGGLDYDGDGDPDLFVGDLVADESPLHDRTYSGAGYVFYDAYALEGQQFSLDLPAPGVVFTTLVGPIANAIAADTAAHGDFDGDGLADLAICVPHASPQGRIHAGAVDVLHGQMGPWPATIDLGALPPPSTVAVSEIQGAHGNVTGDKGDTLCYSGAAAQIDGDGAMDLLINEMLGNGSSLVDVGNLLVIDGEAIFAVFRDAFETGDLSRWTSAIGN